MLTYQHIQTLAQAHTLEVFGGFHPDPTDSAPEGTQTLLMLGPSEPGFWPLFQSSPEYQDGQPDAMDRWSTRVVSGLAKTLGANALFPFGGPPYQPFIAWARRTGRAWQSPAGLLVHDRAGLMVSYRAALAFPQQIDLLPLPAKPCDSCATQPCLTSCPVSALGPQGYDVPACHAYLDTPAGADCMTRGCAARRACPVSQSYGRLPQQSAFHMRSFHR